MQNRRVLSLALTLLLLGVGIASAATMRLYPQKEHFWTGRIKSMHHGYSKHNHTMFFRGHVPDTAWHSWAKFDISGVPDGSTIGAADFVYRCVSVVPKEAPPNTWVRHVAHDPVVTEAALLWVDLTEGPIVAPSAAHGKGWIRRPLNSTGLSALEACLAQDWFALSIHKYDDAPHAKGVALGYASRQNRPYLEITYTPPITGPDFSPLSITTPTGWMELNYALPPQATIHNFGETGGGFTTWFMVEESGVEKYREYVVVEYLAAGAETTIAYPELTITGSGIQTTRCSTYATNDINSANDVIDSWFHVTNPMSGNHSDIGIVVWAPPDWLEPLMTYEPRVVVRDFGGFESPLLIWVMMSDETGEVYRQSLEITELETGGTITVVFPDHCVLESYGEWVVRCSLDLPSDGTPGDNWVMGWVFVSPERKIEARGWKEVASLPQTPSGKSVKKGGWLAYNPGNGLIYAGKGNKTRDFYSYNPAERTWTELAPIRLDGRNRAPSKGTRGISDGDNYVYLTNGSNTIGFQRYDVSDNTWTGLLDVPLGPRNGRVKGGGDMVYVSLPEGDFVYLLKGHRCEFYRYDVTAGTWTTLRDAPTGAKEKWGRGSWLVYDGDHTLYAHKSKRHELWMYDINTGTWDPRQRTGLPLYVKYGTRLRRKKSKDGGSAGWFDDHILALKGGNTQEFYCYVPEADTWLQLDTIPAYGTTGRRKRVKHGGDLVAYAPGRTFYALKGNKTNEFWRFRLSEEGGEMSVPSGRSNVMSGPAPDRTPRLAISSNPASGEQVIIRYSLRQNGPASIMLVDVTGRVMYRQSSLQGTAGSISVPLSNLSPGIYLVRLEAGSQSATRKLVVKH
jgi:N-acetylneuraminic acid mutarotase